MIIIRVTGHSELEGGSEEMGREHAKSAKRTAILEAALELIAEHGFQGAPTARIAEKAGVGVGSIYRYFQDKDELIHEVFKHLKVEVTQEILKCNDPNAPIREQYIRICLGHLRLMVQRKNIFSFIEQYFNSPYGISMRRARSMGEHGEKPDEHPLHSLMEEARVQQIIKDLPAPVLWALTIGPITFLIRDIHNGLVEFHEEMVKRTVEACWDALKR